ncbi:transcriptional regulator, partial [Bacillus toyonensis]
YLLGELYYGKGWNLLRLKQHNEEDVADIMKKALFISELTEKEYLIKIIKENYFENQNKKITHNFLKTTYKAPKKSL